MKRNSCFVCIVWLCMILFIGSQVHSREKKQSPSARADFAAKVTDEDGTVSPSPGTTEAQPRGALISGVLLAQDDAPHFKTEVRLVKVRLVSLLGREILNLPPTETVIIDSDGKAVAVAETDSSGKFDFKDVQPGRYSLAVPSKAGGVADQRWLEESPGRTVFFDVAGTQKVELGRLKAARQ